MPIDDLAPPRPSRGLHNPPMLRFLAAVAETFGNPSASLPEAAGLDAMELAIAISEAKRCGFVAARPEGVKILPAGVEWRAAELACIKPLIGAATAGGLL